MRHPGTLPTQLGPDRRLRGNRRAAVLLVSSTLLVACASDTAELSTTEITLITTAVTTAPPAGSDDAIPTTTPETRLEEREAPATTSATISPPQDPTTTPPATSTTTAPTTAAPAASYAVPVADVAAAGWADGHSSYPATDIFTSCGAELVSPATGTVTEVRTVDRWDPGTDNPATRGGRSVTIVGDDGVRYYLSHLDEVDAALAEEQRVTTGQYLGTVGLTGRTSGCHVHFGISPPCPGKEWTIRRGAIPPARYLDAWRSGQQLSPVEEVGRWAAQNPDACALAMADPFAADS